MNSGEQPCDAFAPQMEANEFAAWPNLHECFAKDCTGEVSLCDNCVKDHHSGGYETCTKIWED